MMLVRAIHLQLIIALLTGLGCSGGTDKPGDKPVGPPRKPIAVCSTAILADFAKRIAGDHVEVRPLFEPGESPATHDLTPLALQHIKEADVAILNGLGLESRIESTIARQLAAAQILRAAEAPAITPLLDDQGRPIADAWLRAEYARVYVDRIREAFSRLAPSHAKDIAARAASITADLAALQEAAGKSTEPRVILCDAPAMRYFENTQLKVIVVPRLADRPVITQADRDRLEQSIRHHKAAALFIDPANRPELADMLDNLSKQTGAHIGPALPRYGDPAGKRGLYVETIHATRAAIDAVK